MVFLPIEAGHLVRRLMAQAFRCKQAHDVDMRIGRQYVTATQGIELTQHTLNLNALPQQLRHGGALLGLIHDVLKWVAGLTRLTHGHGLPCQSIGLTPGVNQALHVLSMQSLDRLICIR